MLWQTFSAWLSGIFLFKNRGFNMSQEKTYPGIYPQSGDYKVLTYLDEKIVVYIHKNHRVQVFCLIGKGYRKIAEQIKKLSQEKLEKWILKTVYDRRDIILDEIASLREDIEELEKELDTFYDYYLDLWEATKENKGDV